MQIIAKHLTYTRILRVLSCFSKSGWSRSGTAGTSSLPRPSFSSQQQHKAELGSVLRGPRRRFLVALEYRNSLKLPVR